MTTGSSSDDSTPGPCSTCVCAIAGVTGVHGLAMVFVCGWILGKSLLVIVSAIREPTGNVYEICDRLNFRRVG